MLAQRLADDFQATRQGCVAKGAFRLSTRTWPRISQALIRATMHRSCRYDDYNLATLFLLDFYCLASFAELGFVCGKYRNRPCAILSQPASRRPGISATAAATAAMSISLSEVSFKIVSPDPVDAA